MDPLRAGDRVTDAMVIHIFDGVCARTLPRAEWTHHAHLVFAAALIDDAGLTGAEAAAPNLIRRYNESVGGVNDDAQGYHHTITLVFLREIAAFFKTLAARDEVASAPGERASALLASPLAETTYPLRFYSREKLFSVAARREFVAPDLAPLTATPSSRA